MIDGMNNKKKPLWFPAHVFQLRISILQRTVNLIQYEKDLKKYRSIFVADPI